MNGTGDTARLSRRRVRLEARPYPWTDLTVEQRQLIVRINDWLDEYVSQPLENPSRSRGLFGRPLVDWQRSSNIILIDGKRGSGKTSVMVTLLEHWRRTLDERDYGELLKADRSTEDPQRVKTLAWLQQFEGRLLPVRILDLQPLPRATSLLPWLAGRLLEVVELLEGVEGRDTQVGAPAPIGSWEPDWNHELKSRRAWQNLVHDTAAGWDGNIGERKATLDPESYAIELGEAERSRLRIFDRWKEFVSAVIADVHARHPTRLRKDARIVIPIDDADMNPHHCIALLDLLRTLMHPQIVFVLTGDSELFQKTLRLHYAGLFRKQLGGREDPSEEDVEVLGSSPSALELSVQHYDKVIPRSQRFSLSRLIPEERLETLRKRLSTFSYTVETGGKPPTLPPTTLAGYFDINSFAKKGLPDSLRRLIDLEQHLGDEYKFPTAAHAIHELWRDALDYEQLSPEHRKLFDPLVQLDHHGKLLVSNRSDLDFNVLSEEYPLPRLEGNPPDPLQVRRIVEFQAHIRINDKLNPLPERLVGLLMLAGDLVQDERPERFEMGLWLRSQVPYYKPISPRELHDIRAHRSQSIYLKGLMSWPLPGWRTFLDLALFETAWKLKLQQLASMGKVGLWGELARFFLIVVCDISEKRQPSDVSAQASWEEVASRLVDSLGRLKALPEPLLWRHGVFKHWLMDMALLLATPEALLPSDDANQFLEAMLMTLEQKDAATLQEVLTRVKKFRRETIWSGVRRQGDTDVEAVLKADDLRRPEYLWGERVERHSKPAPVSAQQLEASLQNIRVVHPQGSSAGIPGTLQEYASGFQLRFEGKALEDGVYLLRELQRLGAAPGTAVVALERLWKFFTDAAGEAPPAELRNAVQREGSHLRIKLPLQLENMLDEGPARRPAKAQTEYPLPRGMRLRTYEALNPAEAFPDQLGRLLQLEHAVNQDENDQPESEPRYWEKPTLDWMTALPQATSVVPFNDHDVEIDWPVPHWPSFFDWLLVDDTWSNTLKQVEGIARGDPSMAESALQGLVYSLLLGLHQIIDERKAVTHVNMKLHFEDWRFLGNKLWSIHERRVYKGHRGSAIQKWVLVGIPFYATPEIGLPAMVAGALLKPWTDMVDHAHRQASMYPQEKRPWLLAFKESMRDLRRLRATQSLARAGLAPNDDLVDQFLEEVDQREGLNHPWVAFFGPIRPASDAR